LARTCAAGGGARGIARPPRPALRFFAFLERA
jgi:hypothetical protein